MRNSVVVAVAGAALAASSFGGPLPVAAAVPAPAAPAVVAVVVQPSLLLPASALKYKFKNCTAMNKAYPHGVGKSGAKDKTSGKPVTTFKRSTSLYKKIVRYRSGLDRDKDGIACEKR